MTDVLSIRVYQLRMSSISNRDISLSKIGDVRISYGGSHVVGIFVSTNRVLASFWLRAPDFPALQSKRVPRVHF